MSEHPTPDGIADRVRRLVESFVETDLIRVRIERAGERIEIGRPAPRQDQLQVAEAVAFAAEAPPVADVDTVRADLVGIFRLSRPAPLEGDFLEGDRELAYVEALGIRNPVRSRGAGRIVAILCKDGDAVDYGRPLFELDRG
jgi:acetyl-CoA carboxylase biotin carboxyl carrier protein